MREKYIEERWPRWGSMTVPKTDLSDVESIQFATAASPEDAQEITRRYDLLMDEFIAMAQMWSATSPSDFRDWWYSRPNPATPADPA